MLYILLKSKKKLSKFACVFVYVLIVVTLMLPVINLAETNHNTLYATNSNLLKKVSPPSGNIQKNIIAKKITKVKTKKIVKKIKHVIVLNTKKTNRSGSERALLLPFGVNVFSAADYEAMLSGTGLDGYGRVFKNIELKYGVNGLFAIGVAMHESALGKDPLSGNNYFGMIGMRFNSPTDNIYYFGHLLSGRMYKNSGLDTISLINSRYASDHAWGERVLSHMNQRAHMVSK